MRVVTNSIITALIIFCSLAFAGTGTESEDKAKELDRILKERYEKNMLNRLRNAAIKAGLDPKSYVFSMTDDGQFYLYNAQRVCFLVPGVNLADPSKPTDYPPGDTINCR